MMSLRSLVIVETIPLREHAHQTYSYRRGVQGRPSKVAIQFLWHPPTGAPCQPYDKRAINFGSWVMQAFVKGARSLNNIEYTI